VQNAVLHHIQENKVIPKSTVIDVGVYHGSKLPDTRI
jgi:hypothetical protein